MEKMSPQELRIRLPKLVRYERKVMAVILEHIAEVDRCRLFFAWGHASLYDYLTKEIGYSESAAYRRMQAARALRQVPEIKTAVENGTLNLSQIAMAQASIRSEEKCTGNKIAPTQRKEIFEAIQSKNTRETQVELDTRLPEHDTLPVVKEKFLRDESVDLHLRIPKDLFAELEKVKSLYSHMIPDGDWRKVLGQMAKDVIQKRDPVTRHFAAAKVRSGNRREASAATKQ